MRFLMLDQLGEKISVNIHQMDLSYDSERPRTKGNQKGTQNFSWSKLEIWKRTF